MDWSGLVSVGFLLVLVGIVLIVAGILAASSQGEGRVEGGGVVVIGPIPIIFGTSDRAALAAAVIGLVMMVLFFLMYLMQRGAVG